MIQQELSLRLTKVKHVEAEALLKGGLYIVASSFEPRSVRATELLPAGILRDAIVFSYEDTLDSVMGRYHSTRIRETLNSKEIPHVDVLRCRFSDPFSMVRRFHEFINTSQFRSRLNTVTIDTTCITKLHLLLLLQYLQEKIHAQTVNILYTEPLSYATAFGKQLSYGIDRTVYLPYQPWPQRSGRVGLVAFLGHERLRVERIIQELEPDISVIILGKPGFSDEMYDDSKRINDTLVHRSLYDNQYWMAEAPSNDIHVSRDVLLHQIERVREQGCDTIYFAPLGTKLQAMSIELVRELNLPVRMLLAYSIPRKYEKSMYSQGTGPTYFSQLVNRVES